MLRRSILAMALVAVAVVAPSREAVAARSPLSATPAIVATGWRSSSGCCYERNVKFTNNASYTVEMQFQFDPAYGPWGWDFSVTPTGAGGSCFGFTTLQPREWCTLPARFDPYGLNPGTYRAALVAHYGVAGSGNDDQTLTVPLAAALTG